MYTEIKLDQGSPEWHEYRSMHIGASDAPIIMGVSPWRNVKQLYNEKLGLQNIRSTPAMQRGIDLEAKARECFQVECGFSIRPAVIESKINPWMCASLDGISKCGQIVEIKCPGKKDHDLALRGQIPDYYYPQLQHQMYVAGVQFAWYYSFDGFMGVAIKCERNAQYIEQMIKTEKDFYDSLMSFEEPKSNEEEFVELDNPSFQTLAEKYKRECLQAKEYEEALALKLAEIQGTKDLILAICQGKNVRGHGIKVRQCSRKGTIDYTKVPELQGVDLEKYRKEASVSWKVEIDKETSG